MADAGRYHVKSGIVTSESGGSYYVTNTLDGSIYELNETASLVFDLLKRGEPPARVADALQEKHSTVPHGEIRRDVDTILADFLEAGFFGGPEDARP